jgi:Cdc6-like AAA superfamily ATPase
VITKSITPGSRFSSDKFLFRDFEFEELLTSFRRVLTNPGDAIARAILIGPPGSGKTFVLNNFLKRIQTHRIIHEESNIELKCIMIDCSKNETSKGVVLAIIHQIDPYFYANIDECQSAELQYILADMLLAKKQALIIIFDNIDSLIATEPEEVNSLLYGFQRFSEGTGDDPNLFSQVLVAHDLDFLAALDRAVFRQIKSDVIPFEPYSIQQTYQLLEEYIKKNIRRKITKETIWFISVIARGNMNLALELLFGADTLAKKNHSITITPEFIRHVNKSLTDFTITKDKIEQLHIGQKLMLLTIARKFRSSTSAFLDFLDLPSLFISICEEYNQLPIAKEFSDVLPSLEKMCLISLHNIDKDIIVTLSDISATEMVGYLEKMMKQKRRDKPFFT